MRIKNRIQKTMKIGLVMLLSITSLFGSLPFKQVEALSTTVTGAEILAKAKTYESWSYSAVGTCTGLVTRVLDDLGIGDEVVGSMVGSMAKYSPDQMYTNAQAAVSAGTVELVWYGYIYQLDASVLSKFENGDLVIQRAIDKAPDATFGHVAFMEVVGTTYAAMYGANNDDDGIGSAIMYTTSRANFEVSDDQWITVYRLVENTQPEYETLTSTKTATETTTVTLTKTDEASGKALSGVTFDFYRDSVKFSADVVTDSNGQASATYTNTYSATSGTYKYCSNYDDLSASQQEDVVDDGYYTSKSAAQTAADKEAQASADALANKSHTYYAVETATKDAYYYDATNNTTSSGSVTGSGSVSLSLTNERITGTATLTKTDTDSGKVLSGATFGLYAATDILDPADGSVIYSANTLITTKTTDSKGQVSADNLYLGSYYWMETEAKAGYYLDTTKINFTLTQNGNTATVTSSSKATNTRVKATATLTKTDVDSGKVLSGATFGLYASSNILDPADGAVIYSANTLITTKTTNSSGVISVSDLYLGSYYWQEITAKDGYVLNANKIAFTLTQNGNAPIVYSNTSITNERIKATAELVKVDTETGLAESQNGDTSLDGAEYELYAASNILDPADGEVIYTANELITTVTTLDSEASVEDLYLGDYYWVETVPGHGYLLDDTIYNFSLTSEGQNVSIVTTDSTVQQQIIKGNITIYKTSTDGSDSVLLPVEGAEFTIKLESEVEAVGWDDAKTYGVATTDASGFVYFEDIIYGRYIIRETSTPDNMFTADDFYVNVYEDGVTTFRAINNEPFESWLRITKTDAFGTTVVLDNATFEIYDENNDLMTFYIGTDSFTQFTTDSNGEVTLPQQLKAGTYYIKEIDTPEGYLLATDTLEVVIDDEGEYVVNDIGQIVTDVVFVNEMPTAKIIVNKIFENDVFALTNTATFVLKANEDIINPANGELIYAEGDLVNVNGTVDGLYTTGAGGNLIISDLPIGLDGASYVLQEVKTADGYVLSDTTYILNFEQEDEIIEVYTETVSMTNYQTNVLIEKKDLDDDALLDGALLQIFDSEGTLITEWESSDEEGYLIQGLHVGKTYTLVETTAPDNYKIVGSVEFTVENTVDIQYVDIYNAKITTVIIEKQDDADFTLVAGAELVLKNENGDELYRWVSSDENGYEIKGLDPGTYILEEITAPDGYKETESIEFEVVSQFEEQTVILYNEKITTVVVEKRDFYEDNFVEGAQLMVLDADGLIVDAWTSTEEGYVITGLVPGTYTLSEINAPEGYQLADDITFEVVSTFDEQVIVFYNKINTIVNVDKLDIYDNTFVEGAKMLLVNEDSLIVATWETTDTTYTIEGLAPGMYTLSEITSPDGYVLATEDVTFEVEYIFDEQFVTFYNEKDIVVEFYKLDSDTEETIVGAKMQLLTTENEILAEWTSSNDPYTYSGLEIGETYVLRETEAPEGYEMAEDVEFTVENTTDTQIVIMYDDAVTVQTGDSVGISLDFYVRLFSISALCIIAILEYRKRKMM